MKLREAVAGLMLKISVHKDDFEGFRQEVDSRIFSGSQVIIVIDAAASRSSVLFGLLNKMTPILSKMGAKWRLWCPLMQRFDTISQLQVAMQEKFVNKTPYVVTSHGQDKASQMVSQQKAHYQPHMHLVVAGKTEAVQAFIPKNGCRPFFIDSHCLFGWVAGHTTEKVSPLGCYVTRLGGRHTLSTACS